ncbi:MAG: hypothetical protein V7K26_05780 [Nostoc sp.]|uniref:hypothetical protein n=1 Tax=Nostoc sp. TaxID=1180 RepID=UPI002FF039DA
MIAKTPPCDRSLLPSVFSAPLRFVKKSVGVRVASRREARRRHRLQNSCDRSLLPLCSLRLIRFVKKSVGEARRRHRLQNSCDRSGNIIKTAV